MQPTTMPDTLYAVERNNSARLANAPQAPSQIQQRPSSAPPAIGTNNREAAQLLRASLQKNKNPANVKSDHPDAVEDGPEPKLARVSGVDSSVSSGVVANNDDPAVLEKNSGEVSLSLMSLDPEICFRSFDFSCLAHMIIRKFLVLNGLETVSVLLPITHVLTFILPYYLVG